MEHKYYDSMGDKYIDVLRELERVELIQDRGVVSGLNEKYSYILKSRARVREFNESERQRKLEESKRSSVVYVVSNTRREKRPFFQFSINGRNILSLF